MREVVVFPRYKLTDEGALYTEIDGQWNYVYPDYRGEYPVWRIWVDGTWTYHKCHRLMAQTFIPNPNHYDIVNHKNGNKRDWRLSNLEWCTRSYNTKHAFETHLIAPRLSTETVHAVCQGLAQGLSSRRISFLTGVATETVSRIYRRLIYTDISSQYTFEPRRRGNQLPDKTIHRICQGIAEGRTLRDISEECGVSASTIMFIRQRKLYPEISAAYTFPEAKPGPRKRPKPE